MKILKFLIPLVVFFGLVAFLAAGMRLQAGLEKIQRGYSFDVKPRWPLQGGVGQASGLG